MIDVSSSMLSSASRRPQAGQPFTQGRQANPVEAVVGEGVNQQGASLGGGNAAGAQIKFGVGIEKAGGGTMTAFHVIGQNFQPGVGIGGEPAWTAAGYGWSGGRRSSGRAGGRGSCHRTPTAPYRPARS
jgi:hypothetical protein